MKTALPIFSKAEETELRKRIYFFTSGTTHQLIDQQYLNCTVGMFSFLIKENGSANQYAAFAGSLRRFQPPSENKEVKFFLL